MPDEREIRRVPLGDLIARQQRVIDAAIAFRNARAAFVKSRTSGSFGRDIGAARRRNDAAVDELVAAVNELDNVQSIGTGAPGGVL